MFIETQTTPNPATLKFLPGQAVLREGTRDYRSADEAQQSPLAVRLFAIPEVAGVFLGADFIAVTRDEADWQHLKPAVLGAIMEHFLSDAPVVDEGEGVEGADEFFDAADAQTVETIKELIETRVRPAVAQDGGDIVFQGFKEGIVYLHMRGACAGCPSSTATLQHGIQNLLRHFVPEVQEVRPI